MRPRNIRARIEKLEKGVGEPRRGEAEFHEAFSRFREDPAAGSGPLLEAMAVLHGPALTARLRSQLVAGYGPDARRARGETIE